MSYFLKRSWIPLTLIAAAFSITNVCNNKSCADKSVPKQIVLDRLVNELVCMAPNVKYTSRPLKWGMSVDGHDFLSALGDTYYCKTNKRNPR